MKYAYNRSVQRKCICEEMHFELIFSQLVSNESKWIAKKVEIHGEGTSLFLFRTICMPWVYRLLYFLFETIFNYCLSYAFLRCLMKT